MDERNEYRTLVMSGGSDGGTWQSKSSISELSGDGGEVVRDTASFNAVLPARDIRSLGMRKQDRVLRPSTLMQCCR